MGKLGRVWVGAWVGAWHGAWCLGGGGVVDDVGDVWWGGIIACVYTLLTIYTACPSPNPQFNPT